MRQREEKNSGQAASFLPVLGRAFHSRLPCDSFSQDRPIAVLIDFPGTLVVATIFYALLRAVECREHHIILL